jgi:outer membrane protein, multidrug efflux system
MSFVRLVAPAALFAMLVGCSVGPNYHSPAMALPAKWSEAGPGGTTNGVPRLARWWQAFHDATLDSLIERAVRSNYNLQAAAARVRAARALRGAAVSDLLPTIDANASSTTARRSPNALSFKVTSVDTTTYQAGFDASWEIDVFGGKRRALEEANATLQSIEADRRSVLVTLLADVARNYIELRATQRRLAIADENIQAQQEAVRLTQLRLTQGLTSELDVSQAKTVLANTQAQVPTLETTLKQSCHQLSVLLGQPPEALDSLLIQTAPIPPTPPTVPVGLPSDLLLRRPDVRSSERQLAAATAGIGVAKAELLPKFSLTGSTGYQSLTVGDLISPQSKFWSAGPSVTWRLLEYPRLRAEIKAQTAQTAAALAQFNQTVITALEDVEDALVAYAQEKLRYRSLNDAVVASRRSLELANQLYANGVGQFLNVLEAERSLYQAEDALVQSKLTMTVNLVALYKALGGGWETTAASN